MGFYFSAWTEAAYGRKDFCEIPRMVHPAYRARCHSRGDHLRGFRLIKAAGTGDGCDINRFSAIGLAGSSYFQKFRASGGAEFTGRPGTASASSCRRGDASTPGGVRADCTRDGRPRRGATAERCRAHRRGGERSSSGATRGFNCRATRCPGTRSIDRRDGCRRRCGSGPPGLPKMPGLPLAGGRQERARPEPRRNRRQEVG